MNLDEIKEKVNKKIKNYKDDDRCEIQYILSKDGVISDIICANLYRNIMFSIDPSTYEISNTDMKVDTMDNDLFSKLNKGMKIEYISDNTHYEMWGAIELYYNENDMTDFEKEVKDGMLKYLGYCKENGITLDYLNEKFDDYTLDIDLLEFYDKSHDYFSVGEYQVNMSKDVFNRRNEQCYFAFALGYDLLYKMIREWQHLDCDSNFDFCYLVAGQFMDSEYYKNNKHSAYEMLCEYVKDNKEDITNSYINFMGVDIEITVKKTSALER